jgi:hypothetical protein
VWRRICPGRTGNPRGRARTRRSGASSCGGKMAPCSTTSPARAMWTAGVSRSNSGAANRGVPVPVRGARTPQSRHDADELRGQRSTPLYGSPPFRARCSGVAATAQYHLACWAQDRSGQHQLLHTGHYPHSKGCIELLCARRSGYPDLLAHNNEFAALPGQGEGHERRSLNADPRRTPHAERHCGYGRQGRRWVIIVSSYGGPGVVAIDGPGAHQVGPIRVTTRLTLSRMLWRTLRCLESSHISASRVARGLPGSPRHVAPEARQRRSQRPTRATS